MARILLIDDEATVRRGMRQILTKGGHEVVEAADGAEGFKLCCDGGIDLVVTDLIMPGVEGLETIERLRERLPDLRIIAISGGTVERNFLRAASLMGAKATLAKPFTAAQLIATVDTVLNGTGL